MNHELPDVQAGVRKGRGTRDQIVNICWIIEKAREFQKYIYFYIDYSKAFDCVDHNKQWKILKRWNIRSLDLPPEKSVCRSRSDRTRHGTQTGSKLEKEHVEVVYCHPAYLTTMQSTS